MLERSYCGAAVGLKSRGTGLEIEGNELLGQWQTMEKKFSISGALTAVARHPAR